MVFQQIHVKIFQMVLYLIQINANVSVQMTIVEPLELRTQTLASVFVQNLVHKEKSKPKIASVNVQSQAAHIGKLWIVKPVSVHVHYALAHPTRC